MHLVLSVIPQRLGKLHLLKHCDKLVKMTDVWAWEKYYKQAEVLQRIDVELLPTEAAVIFHQLTLSYSSLTYNGRRQNSKKIQN